MRERPILFSAPMVRALLDDSKTQTRRVVKPAGAHHLFQFRGADEARGADEPTGEWGWCSSERVVSDHIRCPYGKPGDRLWVRETFYCDNAFYPDGVGVDSMWREADGKRIAIPIAEQRAEMLAEDMYYRADGEPEFEGAEGPTPWRPSIHMPRWASRITLEVTGVRVERLQDISETDAIAEGVEPPSSERDEHDWGICPQCGGTGLYDAIGPNLGVMPDTDCTKCDTHVKRYRYLWESINGEGSWDLNPWVWVVEFRIAPTQQGERNE